LELPPESIAGPSVTFRRSKLCEVRPEERSASRLPDLRVGLGIAAMNADAAREVYEATEKEASEVDA
jgi:hypothetical protein